MIPRRTGYLLATITGFAALLRLSTLSSKSMWIDEGLTALCAQSFAIAFDQCWNVGVNSPGTIFLTVLPYGWWTNDFGLRLVPALFGVASVPALFFLARRWSDDAGGLGAALLLALSPLHLHHSQDARAYSVMIFCSIVSTLALDNLYRVWQQSQPRARLLPWAAAFVLTTLLNLYNQYLVILLVAAHLLWLATVVLLPSTRERARAALAAGLMLLAVTIGFAPWVSPVLLLANEAWVKAPLTRTSLKKSSARNMPGDAASRIEAEVVLKETFVRLTTQWTQGMVPPPGDSRPVWLLFFALAAVGGVALFRRDRLSAALAAFILFSGLSYVAVAAVPLMVYAKVYLYVRHIAFAYPIFVAFQGIALGELWRKRRWAFAVVIGLVFFALYRSLATYFTYEKQDWRSVAAYLAWNARSGDTVVVDCADWAFLSYLQRSGFQFGYQRRQGTELVRGDTVLTYRYPNHPLDTSGRIWWVHGANGPPIPKTINTSSTPQFRTRWGYMGGALEVYLHSPGR